MSCAHTDRCSGHCCKRFYLPLTPAELNYEATREDRATNVRFQVDELEKVHAMVIPLGPAKDFAFAVDGVSPPPQTGYYYTCKHHNAETGNCDNYENRPRMCSNYPSYGNPRTRCEYQDCTWEAGRNPPVPVERWSLLRKHPRGIESQLASCTKYTCSPDEEMVGPVAP